MKTFEQILQYIDETLADEHDKPNKEFYMQRGEDLVYYDHNLEVYNSYRLSLEQLREWMLMDDTPDPMNPFDQTTCNKHLWLEVDRMTYEDGINVFFCRKCKLVRTVRSGLDET